MVSSNQKTNNWHVWRLIVTVLNALAIVLSIILSWHYLKGGVVPGCGNGSSCDQVLTSRWSTIAGLVPISGLSIGAYLAIFVTCLNISASIDMSIRRLSWSVMTILAGAYW